MDHRLRFVMAALVLSTVGCGTMHARHQSTAAKYNPSNGSPRSVQLVVSRTDGLWNAHFSAKLTPMAYYMRDYGPGSARQVSDNTYFRNAEFLIQDPLPPGLRLDESRGAIVGTPTQIGQWHVKIWYRDRECKHLRRDHWYSRSVEFRIFSKLSES